MSLIPLPRSKSQIFTGDTWQGRGGSSEVGSRAWGSRRPVLGSSAPPHPSPGWGARRGCSPASGPCGRCLPGERGPVGGERGWAPRGPGGSGQAGRRGAAPSAAARHPPLLCRKSRALATSCTTTLASSSLKCRRLWMWLRMEPGHGRTQETGGSPCARATARHPPRRARKPPLSLLGPKSST